MPQRLSLAVIRAANSLPGPIAARLRHDSQPARVARPLVNRLLPEHSVEAVVRSGPGRGIVLPIHPRREKFYWTGAHEIRVQEIFARLLRPGAVVWDIGAHIGFFSALAARLVCPGGKVHAFEPLPANRVRLRKTIELNGIREIQVHPTAIASRSGARQLYGHPSTSMWSLVERRDAQRFEVPCVSLDDLLSDGSFGIPALVKIDAEGAELDILWGAGRLLSETSAALIVEFNDERSLNEARSLLPSRSFEELSDSHWLLPEPS